jgi:hypothetical protein
MNTAHLTRVLNSTGVAQFRFGNSRLKRATVHGWDRTIKDGRITITNTQFDAWHSYRLSDGTMRGDYEQQAAWITMTIACLQSAGFQAEAIYDTIKVGDFKHIEATRFRHIEITA